MPLITAKAIAATKPFAGPRLRPHLPIILGEPPKPQWKTEYTTSEITSRMQSFERLVNVFDASIPIVEHYSPIYLGALVATIRFEIENLIESFLHSPSVLRAPNTQIAPTSAALRRSIQDLRIRLQRLPQPAPSSNTWHGTSVFHLVTQALVASLPPGPITGHETLSKGDLGPHWTVYFQDGKNWTPRCFCIDDFTGFVGATRLHGGASRSREEIDDWFKGLRESRIPAEVRTVLGKLSTRVSEARAVISQQEIDAMSELYDGDKDRARARCIALRLDLETIFEASVRQTWRAVGPTYQHKDQCALCQCVYAHVGLGVPNTCTRKLDNDLSPLRCAENDLLSLVMMFLAPIDVDTRSVPSCRGKVLIGLTDPTRDSCDACVTHGRDDRW